MSRSAQNPLVPQPSEMTVAAFVEKVFVPEHVALKRLSGRTHFRSILKFVLRPEEVNRIFQVAPETSKTKLETVPDWPYLGNMRLGEVRPDDVQFNGSFLLPWRAGIRPKR